MNVYVYCVCGTLLLALIAPSFIFTFGACEEPQVVQPLVIVNGSTASSESKVVGPTRKVARISERPTFQAAALQSKDEQAKTDNDEQATGRSASGIVPAVVHPSFAETVAPSTNNEKKEKLKDSNSFSPELPTELSNGLTDTGQAVLGTLAEPDSRHRVSLDTENLTGLLHDTKSQWLEPPHQDNSSDAAEVESQVIELLQEGEVVETVEVPEEVVAHAAAGLEPGVPTTQAPDDIPSFSEWAQKQLEEAEKKKAVHNATTPTSSGVPLKLRSKNYASPDCGAKIVGANAEAVSASAVLSPSRDEYLLNACTNRVWFIVELCDSIQAKKIDIANFELFSSSPKDISVSVSDRFPSRDWRSVGQFTATDVRDVQSYNLHPHLFGKFVKVEIHSHYGAEHFCPVSMLRVYGTSEYEVLETEDEAHSTHPPDDEDEGSVGAEDQGEQPRNLYGIARDAVKSIVKAAEALVIRGEPSTRAAGNASPTAHRSTPRHLVVCKDCNDSLFQVEDFAPQIQSVYDLLAQRDVQLAAFVRVPFVTDALRSGPICVRYGIDFGRRRVTTFPLRHDPGDYLSSLFPPHYMAALCNALAIVERRVVLNTSHALNNVSICNHPGSELEGFIAAPKATCSVDPPGQPSDRPSTTAPGTTAGPTGSPALPEPINPTKTIEEREPPADLSDDIAPTPVEEPLPSTQVNVLVEAPPADNSTLEAEADAADRIELPEEGLTVPVDDLLEEEVFETLLTEVELKELDGVSNAIVSPSTASSSMPPQKESVFVRLSNRLKALERNMSLSGQYLEELSRRYKRQVEEMSRTLNRTVAASEADAKRRDERERRTDDEAAALRHEVAVLSGIVETLLAERDGWRTKAGVVGQHLAVILVEVLVFVVLWYCCRQLPSWEERAGRKWSLGWSKKGEEEAAVAVRRKSVEGVSGHCSPTARRKRPSEVALNIAGTYSELLITESPMADVEGVWSVAKPESKQRKKRRKKELFSKSSAVLSQKSASRKSSVNGNSCVQSAIKEMAIRRSSLSELSYISIPVNGVQRNWNESMSEPHNRVEELRTSEPEVPTVVQQSSENVINTVPKPRTKESLGDSVSEMTHKRNGSYGKNGVGINRRLSSPSFMRTALSSRANRQSSEESTISAPSPVKLKSDNWEFWHSSRKSSQMSLVPSVTGSGIAPGQVDESQSARKKAGGGLKKIVKRFF